MAIANLLAKSFNDISHASVPRCTVGVDNDFPQSRQTEFVKMPYLLSTVEE
jgi:hypothetical protein